MQYAKDNLCTAKKKKRGLNIVLKRIGGVCMFGRFRDAFARVQKRITLPPKSQNSAHYLTSSNYRVRVVSRGRRPEVMAVFNCILLRRNNNNNYNESMYIKRKRENSQRLVEFSSFSGPFSLLFAPRHRCRRRVPLSLVREV